ncbi:Hypothetical predicted protein [Octopus vulgaris]|uniref:Uncharacterized protein n=1 Tax=Octopus vulgaris TaxID=6645 RepID=A0AA36BRT5_OCTVU|nr:Hypothetical predicted protein [Octopus vulgaris]
MNIQIQTPSEDDSNDKINTNNEKKKDVTKSKMKNRSLMFLLQCVTILHFVAAQDPVTESKDLTINMGALDSMNCDNSSYAIIPPKATVSLLQDEVKPMLLNNDVEETIFENVKEDMTIVKGDIKNTVDRKHGENMTTAEKEDKETMFAKFVHFKNYESYFENITFIFCDNSNFKHLSQTIFYNKLR